jgi:hypothetical protein
MPNLIPCARQEYQFKWPGRSSAIFNAQFHGAKIDGERNGLRDQIESEVSSRPVAARKLRLTVSQRRKAGSRKQDDSSQEHTHAGNDRTYMKGQ